MNPALCWAISIIVFWRVSFKISRFAWSELSIVSAAILKIEMAASNPSCDWALASEIPLLCPSFKPSCFPFSKASSCAFLILSSINALLSSINCLLFSSSKLSSISFCSLTLSVGSGKILSSSSIVVSTDLFSSSTSIWDDDFETSEELEVSRAISSNDLFLNELLFEEFLFSLALKVASFTVLRILEISAFLNAWGS